MDHTSYAEGLFTESEKAWELERLLKLQKEIAEAKSKIVKQKKPSIKSA